MALSQRFASSRRTSRLEERERERGMEPSFRKLPDVRFPGRKKVCNDYSRAKWVGAGSLAADRWRPKRTGAIPQQARPDVNIIELHPDVRPTLTPCAQSALNGRSDSLSESVARHPENRGGPSAGWIAVDAPWPPSTVRFSSTLAPPIQRDALKVHEFVNADTIAAGLSALSPESAAALAAGRIMLDRVRELAHEAATSCLRHRILVSTRNSAETQTSQLVCPLVSATLNQAIAGRESGERGPFRRPSRPVPCR
jgi:hypothetical protein